MLKLKLELRVVRLSMGPAGPRYTKGVKIIYFCANGREWMLSCARLMVAQALCGYGGQEGLRM